MRQQPRTAVRVQRRLRRLRRRSDGTLGAEPIVWGLLLWLVPPRNARTRITSVRRLWLWLRRVPPGAHHGAPNGVFDYLRHSGHGGPAAAGSCARRMLPLVRRVGLRRHRRRWRHLLLVVAVVVMRVGMWRRRQVLSLRLWSVMMRRVGGMARRWRVRRIVGEAPPGTRRSGRRVRAVVIG